MCGKVKVKKKCPFTAKVTHCKALTFNEKGEGCRLGRTIGVTKPATLQAPPAFPVEKG